LFSVPSEFDHAGVNGALVRGVEIRQSFRDLGVHVFDCLQDTFAQVAIGVAITQFNGFVFAGGSSTRTMARPFCRSPAGPLLLRSDCRANRVLAALISLIFMIPILIGNDAVISRLMPELKEMLRPVR